MARLRLLSTAILLLANHALPSLSQTLIPGNLPTCAASCAQLQNAQSSCTPAGGAPVSSDAIYQSCFCQSALLTSLNQQQATALCTQCPAADMQTIQTWYQGFCKAGPSALQNGGSSSVASNPATSATQHPTSSVPQVQNNPTQSAGTTVGNSQGVTGANTAPSGPWFSTHWKWVVMLVVLIVGLSAFAVVFSMMHRRYHRRREEQWSQSTVPHPDITTWGPGQSVHDLGYGASLKRSLSRKFSRKRSPLAGGAGGSSSAEKGKATVRTGEVYPVPPMPALKRERESGTGFGARAPPQRTGRSSRTGFGGMF